MYLISFLDRIKPVYILVGAFAFVAVSMLVNQILLANETLSIINSVFGGVISTAVSVFIFAIYIHAKRNNFAFTRTLLWISLSIVSWTLGDLFYIYLVSIRVDPFISPADLFYIAGTVLLIISVLTMPGNQTPSRRRNMVFVEISILVLSAVVLFTILLLLRGKPDLSYDRFTVLMVFIYPVLDIIWIWVIMILFFTYPLKSSQQILGWFFAGAMCLFSSDIFYLIASLYAPLVRDYMIDVGYYLFYVMILMAALSGYKQFRVREPDAEKNITAFKSVNWIIFLPGALLIVIIGLLIVFALNQSFVLSHGIVVLIALIIILFLLHKYMVIAENIKLNKEMKDINSLLESKVEQRTAELQKANTELEAEMLEREKAEEHLARSNQDLALLNRDKDKLFSILAHDLRNPLGSMMNLSSLLAENIKDFDEAELLEIIDTLNKSATQTFQLFNDLLAWSAIQMGRGEREKEIFNLAEIVSENIVMLTTDAKRKQITLLMEIEGSLVVYADKFAVQTVLRNLLSNALKFTPSHGTAMVVAEPSKDFVTISVIDNGVGFAREKLKKIFRVDAVSSSSGTDGEKGTGFGLLLCKDLVERNGGKIWIDSEKGKGSKIFFTLLTHKDSKVSETKIPATSVQYSYDPTRKVTFTSLIGEINANVLRSEFSLIWSSPDYNPDFSVLADLRQATFVMDTTDIPAILEIFSAIPGHKKNRKFALLTATPQQVALSTMFGQNIKTRYPFVVEIFSTYEAALNWLGA